MRQRLATFLAIGIGVIVLVTAIVFALMQQN